MTELDTIPIASYREQYGLKSFVETGCFRGDGIDAAKKAGFIDMHSCDINPDCISRCIEERFELDVALGHLRLACMESHLFIEKTMGILDAPTLFWLDAHLPLYYDLEEPNELSRFPLYAELEFIANSGRDISSDVILCDDVRNITFNNPNAFRPDKDIAAEHCCDFIDYSKMRGVLSSTHTYDDQVIPNVGVYLPK